MLWDWDDDKVAAFDLEVSGKITGVDETGEPTSEYALQPWRVPRGDAWLTSGSVIHHRGGELVAFLSQQFPTKDQLAWFLTEAIKQRWVVVGWNLAYDLAMLIAVGLDDLVQQVQWLDGLLLWRHLDMEPEYEFQSARHKKRKYRLKPEAVETFIPSFAGLDEDVKFHRTDKESLDKLQRYNDRDNVRAWVISKMIWDRLSPAQRNAALIECACLPLVAQANFHGIAIDRLTVSHLSAKLDLDAAARLAELAPYGMTEKVVRSPKQLSALMFNPPEEGGWGLPVLKVNKSKKTGNETQSTDKEVLHELSFMDERVSKVKAYREALNAKGKFCTAVLEALDYNEDGLVHPITNIAATYTHRMTVSSQQGKNKGSRQIGFALHQMKREKEFREIVTVPDGYTMVEFDAAGQEYRWMAVASNDATMLQLCLPGEDMHSYMGAQIVGQDYRGLVTRVKAEEPAAGQTRYLGKFANLSLQYRTSAKKLRSKARVDYGIPMELPEAQRIHATYQRTYPGVPIYWKDQIQKVQALGFVETFGGTRVQVKGNWGGEYGWSMGSTAINTRIQGTGADQKYLAMSVLKPYLNEIGGRFYFELHDGLFFLIPTAKLQSAVDKMKQLLDNLPYREAWGFTPPIPMPWDCKVGKAWGRLREWQFD
jgi:DNA polymerase I-like protein with 3'-5' exonuclease and polymerase domains